MRVHFLCGSASAQAFELCLAAMAKGDLLVLAGESAGRLAKLPQCPAQVRVLHLSEAAVRDKSAVDCAGFLSLCAKCETVICW